MLSVSPSGKIASSEYNSDYWVDSSYLKVVFPSSSSDCVSLFKSDLGLGIGSGEWLPCYGIENVNRDLKCQLVSQSIHIHNYTPLLSTNTAIIHIPKIKNPSCTTHGSLLEMTVVGIHKRKESLLYTNKNIIIPASCTDISKKNV
jgi:hypothetical protein